MDFVRQGIADGCRQSGLATVDSVGNTPITVQYPYGGRVATSRLTGRKRRNTKLKVCASLQKSTVRVLYLYGKVTVRVPTVYKVYVRT